MKIEDLLNAIRELMESPNFEDPLRPEVVVPQVLILICNMCNKPQFFQAYVFQTNQPLYYELTQNFTWDLPEEIYKVRPMSISDK